MKNGMCLFHQYIKVKYLVVFSYWISINIIQGLKRFESEFIANEILQLQIKEINFDPFR